MLSLTNIKIFMVVLLVIAVALFLGLGLQSCAKKIDPIIMAYSPFEGTGLVWIAEGQNFFTSNSIKIIPKKYDTGAGALSGILSGEADIVVGTTEFPIVVKAFQKININIVASIDKSEIIYIIARKDHGIYEASDLRGKIVGTTFGTIAEFYLGRFLELNGMSMQDIVLVDLKSPSEWVDSVVNGDIDAVATAQPYAYSAIKILGSNAVFWSAQGGQLLYSNLIATDEWMVKHPDLVNKLLKSLRQAEEYAIANPSDAKSLVKKYLELDPSYMDIVWSQNQFGLSLEQPLILAMEDEARWMIANNLTDDGQMPYFLDYIDEAGLKAIKPESVNIIR